MARFALISWTTALAATLGWAPPTLTLAAPGPLQPLGNSGTMVTVQYHAPPPPRYEPPPGHRRGMQWVPGHWEWRGHQHVWIAGYWTQARPGHHYRPYQWQEHNGHWTPRPGGWDRDGDGIPNRRDRDRDGDGTPNRHDRSPDNPYRR